MPAFETQELLTAEETVTRVRNVFCVGRNYVDHAAELGNAVPTKPMIFGKSTHALTPAQGEVVLPEEPGSIHHELEIVLFFNKEFEDTASWTNAVEGIALGLDLTDRDAQNELKAKGHPWEYAKGFRQSAVITGVHRVTNWALLQSETFALEKNGQVVQSGCAREMLFDFRTLCAYIHQRFGLSEGDIVYTGTPAGVGPLMAGDRLQLNFADVTFGELRVAVASAREEQA